MALGPSALALASHVILSAACAREGHVGDTQGEVPKIGSAPSLPLLHINLLAITELMLSAGREAPFNG
jgi:hypothetical protein